MINRCVIIGRLTKAVELRYSTGGNAYCSFTLACDRQMKGKDGNKECDFLPVVVPPFRGKLAELCAEYLDKGLIAAVDGSIQARNYTDKDGQKHYITEICAESVRFLSPKGEQQHNNSSTESPLGREVDEEIPF